MRNWQTKILMVMIAVVIFGGAAGIYFYWLDPWISHVQALRNTEIEVPGLTETDVDDDGLSLAEESKLGTSDNLRDSDGDELEDNEELFLGTNPLNPDSDGDGYSDGLEVENDYDPLS